MMGITGNLKLNAKVIIIIRSIKNLQNMHENLKSVPPTATCTGDHWQGSRLIKMGYSTLPVSQPALRVSLAWPESTCRRR